MFDNPWFWTTAIVAITAGFLFLKVRFDRRKLVAATLNLLEGSSGYEMVLYHAMVERKRDRSREHYTPWRKLVAFLIDSGIAHSSEVRELIEEMNIEGEERFPEIEVRLDWSKHGFALLPQLYLLDEEDVRYKRAVKEREAEQRSQ